MTKPKTKACLHCHGMNAANRKTCQSCFASLSIKERIKLKEESLRSGDWGGKVKEHRNAGRVVDSARISVKKLHELDFKPLLFMGRERRGGCSAEVITGIGPIPEGPVREVIKRMTALYEYFLRNYSELLATTTAPSDESAASAASAPPASSQEEPLPVLNRVPVELPPPTAPSLSSSPPTTPSLVLPPLPTLCLSSPPTTPSLSSLPTNLSLPSPPLLPRSLSSPPVTPSLSTPTTLSRSSPPPATPPFSFPSPSNPPTTSPPVEGPMTAKRELQGKRKRNGPTGCKQHTWQKLFFFEKIIERRSNQGIEEVRVHWKSCSACGKEWEDTWEPAVNFSV